MAGAGYKLFNTGDVLTAAQVNTYLMEQSVMVFADAAARTTALTGVVAEGMLSYLKDTNAVEVYDGANWVASDDPNAIQNTIVDAKGDLITATAADTPARLAVGNDGETLVADSAQSTGLAWAPNYAAAKNKLINADFRINQRQFTSTTTTATYGFDRWVMTYTDGTVTYSAQTFTPGTAPVAGYEAANFARVETTGQTATNANALFRQRIEDVRTVTPGNNWTVSFWAKAASGAPKVYVELEQSFGTGGSPSSNVVITGSQVTLSTSWARYSVTIAVPSISGKTIGTTTSGNVNLNLWVSAGTDNNARTGSLGIQTNTFDFWGGQVEAGSVATAFQTATGTLQGELAACQRYYFRNTGALIYLGSGGIAGSTTQCYVQVKHPTTMRVSPTVLDSSLLLLQIITGSTNVTSASISSATPDLTLILANVASGLTATTQSYMLMTQNTATAHLGLSAEL
jgi:hypothetical protein